MDACFIHLHFVSWIFPKRTRSLWRTVQSTVVYVSYVLPQGGLASMILLFVLQGLKALQVWICMDLNVFSRSTIIECVLRSMCYKTWCYVLEKRSNVGAFTLPVINALVFYPTFQTFLKVMIHSERQGEMEIM